MAKFQFDVGVEIVAFSDVGQNSECGFALLILPVQPIESFHEIDEKPMEQRFKFKTIFNNDRNKINVVGTRGSPA